MDDERTGWTWQPIFELPRCRTTPAYLERVLVDFSRDFDKFSYPLSRVDVEGGPPDEFYMVAYLFSSDAHGVREVKQGVFGHVKVLPVNDDWAKVSAVCYPPEPWALDYFKVLGQSLREMYGLALEQEAATPTEGGANRKRGANEGTPEKVARARLILEHKKEREISLNDACELAGTWAKTYKKHRDTPVVLGEMERLKRDEEFMDYLATL